MADFYEVDFLEVHTSKSGDAISLRYEQNGVTSIHVVDGGYAETGPRLVLHINKHYGYPGRIDHVVVTHPDQDHAEGLVAVLESFQVGTLWILLPWNYVDTLIDRFERYTNADNLKRKLKEAYPYIARLEEVAVEYGIPMREPFQGARIGAFTVLTPSITRYFDLVVTSAKTPAHVEDSLLATARSMFAEAARKAASLVRAAWGEETFPTSGTSNENEMSVVQYATLCGERVVLTADSGRDGLAEAADYAPMVGLALPGVEKIQVPHHGGRHNVSTDILDRWLGPRKTIRPAPGTGDFTAVVSAADSDEDHPRKVVTRAFIHRGAVMGSTEGKPEGISVGYNAPARDGWSPSPPLAYPEEVEE